MQQQDYHVPTCYTNSSSPKTCSIMFFRKSKTFLGGKNKRALSRREVWSLQSEGNKASPHSTMHYKIVGPIMQLRREHKEANHPYFPFLQISWPNPYPVTFESECWSKQKIGNLETNGIFLGPKFKCPDRLT